MKYDSLANVIDRHGSEWSYQMKMCSQCGHVVGFATDGSQCHRSDCDGVMRSVESFVDVEVPDTVAVLEAADKLDEAAETAKNDGRRREKQTMQQVAESLRDAV